MGIDSVKIKGMPYLPEIPNSWLITVLLIGLVIMRCFGVDSFTTAGISLLIGYITGKHVEQSKCDTKGGVEV